MNYKALSHAETSFTLFAFKRVLRDHDQLTPTMVQFYERSIVVLKEKCLNSNPMKKTADRMEIAHEIAKCKFRLYGLITDCLEARELQQEIINLQEQASRLVYSRPFIK